MKQETKLLKIEQVEFRKRFYPREFWSKPTSIKYAEAMKAGATLPNIKVAHYDNEYILIDGKHRLEAYKINEETHIQADVLIGLSLDEIYLEAVKSNAIHGRQFSQTEKCNIVATLKKMKLSLESISKVVFIPTDKLELYSCNGITNELTGESVEKEDPFVPFGSASQITKEEVVKKELKTYLITGIYQSRGIQKQKRRTELVIKSIHGLEKIKRFIKDNFHIEEVKDIYEGEE